MWHIRRQILVSVLLFAARSVAHPQEVEDYRERPVWHWANKTNAELVMNLEFLVDGKIVKKIRVPIRKQARKEVEPEDPKIDRNLMFVLDHSHKRPSYGVVNGSIWENGYEAEGSLVGVMVSNRSLKSSDKRIINERLLVPANRGKAFNLGYGVVVHSRCEKIVRQSGATG